jgi:hypothetical protein
MQQRLVDTETKRQQLLNDAISYELDVTATIQQIHTLRQQVGECFKIAAGEPYVPQGTHGGQHLSANSLLFSNLILPGPNNQPLVLAPSNSEVSYPCLIPNVISETYFQSHN